MKKGLLLLVVAMCAAGLPAGCITSLGHDRAVVKLNGNPTTGYNWSHSITPEGIVELESVDYKQDRASSQMTGVGGTFTFTFVALNQGNAEIIFAYEREWEDQPPVNTAVYRATVDADNNLKLEEVQPAAN
ncbi:MAG: protease inhibitor I42 family protein [Coriobacteriia bacterium]|nr:protease inhibitor I42 family protein [Coriobacteriia bacterium]